MQVTAHSHTIFGLLSLAEFWGSWRRFLVMWGCGVKLLMRWLNDVLVSSRRISAKIGYSGCGYCILLECWSGTGLFVCLDIRYRPHVP